MLSDWIQVVKKMKGGQLVVYHRPGDELFPELAYAYWENRLPDMLPVPSSTHAQVHRRGGLYFKRFLIRDWLDTIKHVIRDSRARRALQRGEEIQSLGFHAPRAVCLIEERRQGVVCESALITEAIEHAPNMRDWLNKQELGIAGVPTRKRDLLRAFGQQVGAWHTAGLHHADMRIGNILCREANQAFEFFWLDNEGVQRQNPLPRRLRVHNLMQVNMERTGVSFADRYRFWLAYRDAARLDAADEKALMHDVIDYTRSRWKKRGWM